MFRINFLTNDNLLFMFKEVKNNKMQLKQGDILACKNNSFLSRFIRYITKSNFSHLAIVVNENEAIESDGISGFIKHKNINEYINYASVYSCDSLSEDQRNNICQYAISKVGQKYDYYLIFVLFLRYVFGLRIKIKDGNEDICSELVNDSYKSVNVILSKKRFPIPDDVLNSDKLRKVGSL